MRAVPVAVAVGLSTAFALALLAPQANVAETSGSSIAAFRPLRPAPQPEVPPITEGGAEAVAETGTGTAADGPATRPELPTLAEASDGVVLYSVSCGTLRAVQPSADGQEYQVDGTADACSGQWTPDGRLLVGDRADGAQALRLVDRGGKSTPLSVPGRDLLLPVAFGADGRFTVCAAMPYLPGRAALYRWSGGDSGELTLLRDDACYPAVAADGALAWAGGADVFPDGEPAFSTLWIQLVGEAPREVARIGGPISAVDWTGDGRRVVVAGGDRVMTVTRDGEQSMLATADTVPIRFAASPRGSRVAVVRDGDFPGVQSIDADTNETEWFLPTDGPPDLTWEPAGARLLVADRQLWTWVEPASGRIRLRLERLGDAPVWCCPAAGAGSQQAPALPADVEPQQPLGAARSDLILYAVRCGDLRALGPLSANRVYAVNGLGDSCSASWAPDGSVVANAASTGEPSVAALRIRRPDGTTRSIAIAGRNISGPPAWWADGTAVVCAADRRPPYRPYLYLVPPRGKPRLLGPGCHPAISSSGLLAYAAPLSLRSPRGLRQVRLADRSGRVLLTFPLEGQVGDVAWTGDGQRMMVVLRYDGGDESDTLALSRGGDMIFLGGRGSTVQVRPAPVGQKVVIVAGEEGRAQRVLLVDAITTGQSWTLETSGVTRVSWRPDGSSLLVADEERWRVLDARDGSVLVDDPSLGQEPDWCCPIGGDAAAGSR